MDKFLLAENPMRSPKGGLCIIKTVLPIGIFQVFEDHLFFDTGKYRALYRHYVYKNEQYTLRLHYYGGFGKETPSEEEVIERAFSDMDNAWHWFKSYMKFEDEI